MNDIFKLMTELRWRDFTSAIITSPKAGRLSQSKVLVILCYGYHHKA